MADVYLGRFNRWVEKVFNVKGGPTVVDIDPGVRVVVPIDRPVEDRFPQGWNRFGSAINSGAAAASNAQIQLRNPAGSNVLAVIESMTVVQFSAVTRSKIDLGIITVVTDLATVVGNNRLDARTQAQGSSIILSATGTGGSFGSVIDISLVTGTTLHYIYTSNQELTLLPGDGYRVSNETQNEGFVFSAVWRERAMESSELT